MARKPRTSNSTKKPATKPAVAAKDVAKVEADAKAQKLADEEAAKKAVSGKRLFPVAYDLRHDGALFVANGDDRPALNQAQHAKLKLSGAVAMDWNDGEAIK